ncbi:MAG TPA: PQQ-binding-like beta-propeller repeat protein [Pirellulaceae bacterium]|nr:PQQ-binding-like beta-propeller repeat protein [Pirellulaceae bacterium]
MLAIRRMVVVGFLICLLGAPTAWGETWPAWRGKSGRGVSSERGLPTEWSIDKNLAWQIDVPGRSNASPAVTQNRVYLTSQTEDKSLWVIAIDREDGRIVWKRNVGSGELTAEGAKNLYAHRHNPATSSPVADDDNVWAFFGTGLLVCLDRNGETRWKRNLVEQYGAYTIRFGMASSPRLWGELLYIACMTKGPSYVLALQKTTGEEVWKSDRRFPAKDDGPDSYSSPVVLQTKTRSELIVSGGDHVNAYDLLTGKQLWVSGGLTIDSPYGRVIASPAVSEQVLVVSSANPPGSGTDHVIALRTGGSGDITETHRLWDYRPFNPDASTPVCYEGNVYMVRDDGIASCLDLKTGKLHWRKRLSNGVYRTSLVAGDSKVYFLQREGLLTVIEAGPEGKVLARNQLPGIFYATPAISQGVLYLHAYGRLYAVAQR